MAEAGAEEEEEEQQPFLVDTNKEPSHPSPAPAGATRFADAGAAANASGNAAPQPAPPTAITRPPAPQTTVAMTRAHAETSAAPTTPTTCAAATAAPAAAAPRLRWTPDQQGWIFGAFNAGLLCMLLTGFLADKFNAKQMIVWSVLLASVANVAVPLTAPLGVHYVVGARFLVGVAEALLQPAINSLVTRWFPASERSYALGLATGGRQFGELSSVDHMYVLYVRFRSKKHLLPAKKGR